MLYQILFNNTSFILEINKPDLSIHEVLELGFKELIDECAHSGLHPDPDIAVKEVKSFEVDKKTYTTINDVNKKHCLINEEDENLRDAVYGEHCSHIEYTGKQRSTKGKQRD